MRERSGRGPGSCWMAHLDVHLAGWRVGLHQEKGALWGGWGQGDKFGPGHTECEARGEHPVETPKRRPTIGSSMERREGLGLEPKT